jgi:polar amino acid transport system ATP-binding protein
MTTGTDHETDKPAPLIDVRHLTKSFGDLTVLRDISFTVHEGDVVTIIGPSGGGKSTLLRCVTHLEKVTGGTILIGKDAMVRDGVYAEKHALRRICLRMGLVFQNFNLFPHFSVLRNITEAQIHVLKRPADQARTIAMSLLDKMGLSQKANAYPFELSGGQQQRVSIARALALQPDILFFDEPTSALDPELTGEILKVIRSLAAVHMTMVIVTHEMAFARDVSDRTLFIDGGLIIEDAPSRQLFDSPSQDRTKAFLSRMAEK